VAATDERRDNKNSITSPLCLGSGISAPTSQANLSINRFSNDYAAMQ
jgi:hypothetical protein